jgi:DNA repair photolyase
MMTITSVNDSLSEFWEPGAPDPQQRILALRHAFEEGYQTSVSVEPMLGGIPEWTATLAAVEPFVTHQIWFGRMNKTRTRVSVEGAVVEERLRSQEKAQRDSEILRFYGKFKNHPKIAWKDSIKKLLDKENAK